MSIQTYSAERIGLLKQTLLNSAEAGKPQDYEIRVDDMRVVPRTNDVEQFDNYEDFVTEETKKIVVLVYDGSSRRNEKHNFLRKDDKKEKPIEKGLSGTEVTKIIHEKLEQQKQEWKQEQMEKENKELKKKLEESEGDFDKAAVVIEKLKGERSLEDMQWGKILGVAGDTLIRSNTKFLATVPGMAGLAGIIEADNKEREKQIASPSPEPELEASYSMKSEKNENEKKEEPEKKENESSNKNSQASEEERDRIGLIRQLNQRFEKKQVGQVFSLLNLFIDNPKAIEPTLSHALQRKAQCSAAKSETKQPEQTEKKEEKMSEKNQESLPKENSEQQPSSEIKPEHLENASEQTNSEGVENQKKEIAYDEIPITM